MADDASPKPHVRRVLDEYAAADSRIKVVYRQHERQHLGRQQLGAGAGDRRLRGPARPRRRRWPSTRCSPWPSDGGRPVAGHRLQRRGQDHAGRQAPRPVLQAGLVAGVLPGLHVHVPPGRVPDGTGPADRRVAVGVRQLPGLRPGPAADGAEPKIAPPARRAVPLADDPDQHRQRRPRPSPRRTTGPALALRELHRHDRPPRHGRGRAQPRASTASGTQIRGDPLVSLVIPSACREVEVRGRQTWFVLECVSSIRRLSTYKNLEIVVIDNHDMSDELAARLEPLDVRRTGLHRPRHGPVQPGPQDQRGRAVRPGRAAGAAERRRGGDHARLGRGPAGVQPVARHRRRRPAAAVPQRHPAAQRRQPARGQPRPPVLPVPRRPPGVLQQLGRPPQLVGRDRRLPDDPGRRVPRAWAGSASTSR